jgi:hypothetical protein
MIPLKNISGWPLYKARLKATRRSRHVQNWDFYAPNIVAAQDYIRSRDGYKEAFIIDLQEA